MFYCRVRYRYAAWAQVSGSWLRQPESPEQECSLSARKPLLTAPATRLTNRKLLLQIFRTWHFTCLSAVLWSIQDPGSIFGFVFYKHSSTRDSAGRDWCNPLKVSICEALRYFWQEQWWYSATYWRDIFPGNSQAEAIISNIYNKSNKLFCGQCFILKPSSINCFHS